MGDGKASSSTASAVPRVAAKRSARFATRQSTRSFNVERPPIIIDMGSSVVKVGYAQEFKPKHLIPYPSVNSSKTLSESQWYSILSPLIAQVYDRLMVNPTSRRVMVVHEHYPQKSWEAALKQVFWNRGVPAVSFVSSLDMVPVAQGWKRGIIFQVGKIEAVCVAHVDGHILPYTCQFVPCGYESFFKDGDSSDVSKIQTSWNDDALDPLWLNENYPNSLVAALLKCLEACPRDTRKYVISNVIFCGDAVVLLPDLGRRVAKRLKDLLEGSAKPYQTIPRPKDPVSPEILSVVPVDIESLKPLAFRLAVASCAPYRADFIFWVGASLWVATWHKYDDEMTPVHWTFAPSET